jgi:hypothetical protein
MNYEQNHSARCLLCTASRKAGWWACERGLVAADSFDMQTDQWRSEGFSRQSLLGGGVRQLPESVRASYYR